MTLPHAHLPLPRPQLTANMWKFLPFPPWGFLPFPPLLTSQHGSRDDVSRSVTASASSKRRAFDVESLLAPEAKRHAPAALGSDVRDSESPPADFAEAREEEEVEVEEGELEARLNSSESDAEHIDVDGLGVEAEVQETV